MELIFLGTGAGKPSKERNVTAIVLNLKLERQGLWLFDCGEGTQHQMLRDNINPVQLEKIFITHLHGDHIFGLPGLLSSRSMATSTAPLRLYGPPGIKLFIDTTLAISDSSLTYPLEIIEINPGTIFADPTFQVSATRLDHRIETYGYRIWQQYIQGSLDMPRLLQDAIQPGPIYQALKRGDTVLMPDGRQVDGSQYLGHGQPGKVIAIFGDTRPTAKAQELAYQADVLVHEATLEAALANKAHQYGHSTTLDAATLARESQVGRLFITHISNRYLMRDTTRLLAECRDIFPATEMATDFSRFSI